MKGKSEKIPEKLENLQATTLLTIGWREWISLPDLNIPGVKAKIDTGARTSTLHTFRVEPYRKCHQPWVKFAIHPDQYDARSWLECHAAVKDQRIIRDSGGHEQLRYVIETQMRIGHCIFMAEMSLTCRDDMRFRMLLGRTALNGRFVVNPQVSYLFGKPASLIKKSIGASK